MACNDKNTDCAPCQDCPPVVPPVLPRCQDVVLTDGVYINATIVVDQGCIVQIAAGEPFAYQPDVCCPTSGGGGGEDGLMGPPGPAGAPATITIGSVATVAYGDPPTVVNSGTVNNAVFNFEIPAGQPGADGESPTGVTLDLGAWAFEDGLVKELPPDFPPISTLNPGVSDVVGLSLTIVKDPTSGSTVINIDGDAFYSAMLALIAGVQSDITAVAAQATWGGIPGTLSDQTDLWNALLARPRWTYSETAPIGPNAGDRWWRISTGVETVWIAAGVNAWVSPL